MGLSIDGVREVARAEFGLKELGLTEARDLHRRLLDEVFPELGAYLREDTLELMTANLGTTQERLLEHLRFYFLRRLPPLPQLRRWFWGDRDISDFVECRVGALLEHCGRGPLFEDLLGRWQPGRELYLALFAREVKTLTGRVRGRLLFGEARGAEYLDLADDAAKEALFSLVAAGLKVAGYAGGRIVLETPIGTETQDRAQRAEGLASGGAETVLGGIPVPCFARLQDSW
jgi:hypothetical protein